MSTPILATKLYNPPPRPKIVNRQHLIERLNEGLRLARYSGTSPQFWMGLQTDYDLVVAADALGNRLEVEVRPMAVSG